MRNRYYYAELILIILRLISFAVLWILFVFSFFDEKIIHSI